MDVLTDPRLRLPHAAGTPGQYERFQVSAGVVALRTAPQPDAEMASHALGGEILRLAREEGEFGLVQSERDGYVGWALMEALSQPVLVPTHRVSALRTYVFSEPSIKSAPHFLLSLNAQIAAEGEDGRFVRAGRMGWVVREHLAPLDGFEDDPAGVAERYVGTPYLWGGKESLGLDCSGLVQMAYMACGVTLPRDTDMQFALAGDAISDPLAEGALQRGDLVFWKGHVGLMLDAVTLLHANAHHMMATREPLAAAVARIGAAYGPVTGARRIETAALRGERPFWLDQVLG